MRILHIVQTFSAWVGTTPTILLITSSVEALLASVGAFLSVGISGHVVSLMRSSWRPQAFFRPESRSWQFLTC